MKAFYWTAGVAFVLVGGWVLIAPNVGREAGESLFGTPPGSKALEASSRTAPAMLAAVSSRAPNEAVAPILGDVTLSIC